MSSHDQRNDASARHRTAHPAANPRDDEIEAVAVTVESARTAAPPPPSAEDSGAMTILSTLVGENAAPAQAASASGAGGTVRPDDVRRDWGRLGTSRGQSATGAASVLVPDPVSRRTTTVNVTLRPSRMSAAEAAQANPNLERDFTLEKRLGVGGMGEVFRARQMSLNREVAVKIMRPDRAADENQRAKFVAEAVITGALDHPNIIPLHELGLTASGHVFYAMKEVKGSAWNERLRQLSEAENIDILLRVADAVAFAHDRGVIHRDLKPHNVMIGDYGEVLVMDWGLAAPFLPDESGQRPAMGRAGTPAYMPPEMARADESQIGPAADIYLLGAILHEILAGRPPHTGANVYACIAAAANNRIEALDRDDGLAAIARRAMATKPAGRYASVKDFQAAIREQRRNAESLALAERARENLANAKDYDDHHKAVFGYGEALALWPGNQTARHGLWEARRALAERARQQGDFDLALNTARAMDVWTVPAAPAAARAGSGSGSSRRVAPDPAAEAARKANAVRQELIDGSEAAAREARQRKERLRRWRRAAVISLAAVAVVLVVATVVTGLLYRDAEKARAEEALAHEREAQAHQEREVADRQRLREQQARLAALEAEKREREAREEAERRLDEAAARLARNALLVENDRWVFSPQEAARRQEEAARRQNALPRFAVALPGASALAFEIIPPGEFVMGSVPPNDLGRVPDPDRKTHEFLHPVRINRVFWLAAAPLTRGQWRALVPVESEAELTGGQPDELVAAEGDREAWLWRTRPLEPADAGRPATGISHRDVARLLLPALAGLAPEGMRFRLPTEAEWEYACRAGTATRYHAGDAYEDALRVGWFADNSDGAAEAFPVARLAANAWGLRDMHGNVYELVADHYAPAYYLDAPLDDPYNNTDPEGQERFVARGGSFVDHPRDARAATRVSVHAANRYFVNGVRLALSAVDPDAPAPAGFGP